MGFKTRTARRGKVSDSEIRVVLLCCFSRVFPKLGVGRNWLDLTVFKRATREEIEPLLIFVRKNLAIRGIV